MIMQVGFVDFDFGYINKILNDPEFVISFIGKGCYNYPDTYNLLC